MTAPDEVPTWIELLVRMCAGEDTESPFVGVLEVPYEDDDDRWPSTVRVFKDRARYRVESLEGRVLTIRQPERTWSFRKADEPPVRVDNEGGYRHVASGAHGHVIQRRPPNEWDDDDFTTPTGLPKSVRYLDRDAWEVELAPPERKPSALVLTIDAKTGMVYQQRSVTYGVLSRWTEITEVESHPDELFEWDGDETWYTSWVSEVTEEDLAEERRQDAEEAAALGIPALSVPIDLALHVYVSDDSGAFHAGFNTDVYGSVHRRPRSDEPWDLDQNFEHEERWSDAEWDWCVASDDVPQQLASIRAQLVEPRPDQP